MHLLFTCADTEITTRNNRGYAIHIRELLDALLHQEVTVTPFIAGNNRSQPEPKRNAGGFKSILKNSFLKPLAYRFRDQLRLVQSKEYAKEIMKQLNFSPDVIYERYEGISALGLNLSQNYNVPLILEINAPFWQDARYYNQHRTRFAEKIDLQLLRQAQAIVVVSEILKQYLLELGLRREKVRVIPNGVNAKAFSEAGTHRPLPQLENRTIIGYVGSFSKWHRLDYLVQAAQQLNDPSIHFLLVGTGADRARIEALVQELQLAEKFTFTGEISYAEIPAYLQQFDIAVLPHTEAYCSPIKIFEYMAARKPVVVPDLSGLRRFISHDQTGILFKENNISDFLRAIRRLIADPVLRREIGEKGYNQVKSQFSWTNTATQIIELIHEIKY